jgi:hypothetical protein
LNDALSKISNNTFRTKKIKIPEDKKLKTYEHIKYLYELIGKDKKIRFYIEMLNCTNFNDESDKLLLSFGW